MLDTSSYIPVEVNLECGSFSFLRNWLFQFIWVILFCSVRLDLAAENSVSRKKRPQPYVLGA